MATTYDVRLVGGPCGGTTKTIPQAEWDSGETSCKGATYVFDGIIRPSGQLPHFTFRAGAPPPPSSSDAQGLKGWKDLRRTINRTMLHTLNETARLQHAALRAISRGRKVRL